ncbi:MAG: hypothetical protein WC977_01885 [Anaerovoracaceae bacterium]
MKDSRRSGEPSTAGRATEGAIFDDCAAERALAPPIDFAGCATLSMSAQVILPELGKPPCREVRAIPAAGFDDQRD